MCWTDDPVADYDRYSDKCEKALSRLPVCCECGEHVQEDHFYLINDEVVCPECLQSNHRKDIEDYAW